MTLDGNAKDRMYHSDEDIIYNLDKNRFAAQTDKQTREFEVVGLLLLFSVVQYMYCERQCSIIESKGLDEVIERRTAMESIEQNSLYGRKFSIAKENPSIPGCTISKEIHSGENYITVFSLAKNTDISAEIYPYYKMIVVAAGSLEVYGNNGFTRNLETGDSIVTLTDTPMGMRTSEGTVYTEVAVRKDDIMNELIKAGEVFRLAELVPYADGKIVNMDVVHNDKMKFVVMAFDEGTGLSEHAAPGEAIIFALDGEGVIGYEGEEHPIQAGENFRFAKGGLHSVKATRKFKMALLLTLE